MRGDLRERPTKNGRTCCDMVTNNFRTSNPADFGFAMRRSID